MAQYISKDALVAEIERRMKLRHDSYKTHRTLSDFIAWEELEYFKEEFLSTLEVKEVDLAFMLHEYWNLSSKITIDCLENATMTKDEMINFAKHFFELGLKAQKGE